MKYIYVIIFILAQLTSYSQKRDKGLEFYYDNIKKFNVDYLILPDDNLDSIDVIIFYRYNYSFFPFEKVNSSQFVAYSTILIDFKNSEGIIKKSLTKIDTLVLNNFEETKSKTAYFKNFIRVKLYKENYTVFLDLSHKFEKLKSQKFSLIFKNDFTKINKLLFVNENKENEFMPFIMDSSISFSSKSPMILFISDKKNQEFNFSVNSNHRNNNDFYWVKDYKFDGKSEIISSDFKLFDISNLYKILNSNNLQLIALKLDNFIYPGNYNLIIQNDFDKQNYNFKVVWDEMPLSLKNPEYAAEMMYYILDDSQYNKIYSGNKQEIFNNILNYWKDQDPIPATPLNEKMFEYFKRVDYSFFNYQTINEKDGAKTDRGKIYILYGKPDKVDRVLGNNKNTETWYYKKSDKTFIFETAPNGNFFLKDTK